MQVSFGKIYVINERESLTPSQYRVTEAIKDTFGLTTMATYYDAINIEEFLKGHKNADVFIRNRKNGSTSLEIRQDAFDPYGESGIKSQGFIPYDSKGKEKLMMININSELDESAQNERSWMKALAKVKRNLIKFMKKCEQYAIKPQNEKNIELAENNEIKWEKELLKRENAILAQITSMENYGFENI